MAAREVTGQTDVDLNGIDGNGFQRRALLGKNASVKVKGNLPLRP